MATPKLPQIDDWIICFANVDLSSKKWMENLKAILPEVSQPIQRETSEVAVKTQTVHCVDALWPDLKQVECFSLQAKIKEALEDLAWKGNAKKAQFIFASFERRCYLKENPNGTFSLKQELCNARNFGTYISAMLGEFLITQGQRRLGKCEICNRFFLLLRERRQGKGSGRLCYKPLCKSKFELKQRIVRIANKKAEKMRKENGLGVAV